MIDYETTIVKIENKWKLVRAKHIFETFALPPTCPFSSNVPFGRNRDPDTPTTHPHYTLGGKVDSLTQDLASLEVLLINIEDGVE